MSQDAKKKIKLPPWLNYVLVGLEIALMIGLVVIAFLTMSDVNKGSGGAMTKWLISPPIKLFMLIVFPLIVLFLFNVYLLIKVMNDTSNKEHQALTKEELIAEARRLAREELENELAKRDAASQVSEEVEIKEANNDDPAE